jgi:Asp-tRNA(Asn)/Glu-tRNA(Gln) amidotransferase A subunit family amidase
MLPSNYFTATATLEAISRGDITARQVVEDHKERYLARDGELKAWVNVRHDEAMEEMQGKKGLPLYGVVVGVKDIISESSPCSPYIRMVRETGVAESIQIQRIYPLNRDL